VCRAAQGSGGLPACREALCRHPQRKLACGIWCFGSLRCLLTVPFCKLASPYAGVCSSGHGLRTLLGSASRPCALLCLCQNALICLELVL
jgi:hypothetical protein